MNSRMHLWWGKIAVALVFLLIAGPVSVAQNSPSPPSSDNALQPQAPPVSAPADSYAVSLGTGQLINLSGDDNAGNASNGQVSAGQAEYSDGLSARAQTRGFSRQFFYGASVATTYVSAYAGIGTPGQTSTTISPYIGLLVPTKTGSFMLQYDAVVNPRDPNVLGGGPQAYQAVSLTAQGAFTRRWSWTLIGSGGYGSEATRLEGPLTFSLVQNTPVLDASSTVVLPATNVLFVANTARLVFQKDERNSFGFTLLDTYTGIDGNPNDPGVAGEHSNAVGVKVDYGHAISSRLILTSYADEQTVLSGPVCYSYGGGVGLSAKLTRAVSLDVQGGPQFTSSECGARQAGSFIASIVDRISRKDRIYASVSREFTTAYQARGTWQDNVAVGFAKSLGRSTFATDAGFVRNTLPGAQEYHGYFVAPRFQVKIANSLGFSAGYRAFRVTGGGLPNGVLNIVAVSIDWYPPAMRFK
jgi:hypothetical protein